MELKLERPIVFFDLETTGTNITRDRIVELSYIKVYPDGREEEKSRRLNPADFSKMGNNLDLAARIVEDANGVPVFNFGKHKGKPVKEVLRREPSFYDWMMQGDFPKNTKDVLFQLKYKYDSERKKS